MIVTELNVYPLKSGGATALREAELTRRGLRHDRELMLIGPSGRQLTQREVPRMARLSPSFDGQKLSVGFTDRPVETAPLVLEVRRDGPARDITLFGDLCRGVDQGDEAAGWFSGVLGTSCRLVAFPDDHVRRLDPLVAQGEVGYADSAPLLITSEESLAELNRRLPEPVPMNRFRPNIVISGWAEPFGEDRAHRLGIGRAEIDLVRGCGRCVITTVDQETGIKGREPLRTLAGFRVAGGRILFGRSGVPRVLGDVQVGDRVEILRRQT